MIKEYLVKVDTFYQNWITEYPVIRRQRFIRCMECKNYDAMFARCNLLDRVVPSDGYCHMAERVKHENNH